ncbi:uncharacterized protein MYCFIDRAFT_89224 [Pseudocercospora fijiensis CIRAD86]|uniref:Cell wall mannoprotein PIR1-like C-terminal domain-containing protein n=1 Tax=Pseudocercospora fijiensis (strain CIRAD86) TaxID=383855 RepID=N1Q7D6_PSEFD|nr:uncharacterized protein MYCFIDRAFT_89224 [Pseudocercospora fijiensis CIRAD86]EME88565.1 hypothetical protein MYCFIDRAFT_89224 [Pseudocercospora fijiensis CIRAD86]
MKIARTIAIGTAAVGSLIHGAAAGSQDSGKVHSPGKKLSPPGDSANHNIIHPNYISTHTTDIDPDSWRVSTTSIPLADPAKPLIARELPASELLMNALTTVETVFQTAVVTVFAGPPSTSAHHTKKFTVTAPQPAVISSVTASSSQHTRPTSTVTASAAVATETEVYHLGGHFEKVSVDGTVMVVPVVPSTTFTRVETLVGYKNQSFTTTRTLTAAIAPSGPYNGYDCVEELGKMISCLWPGRSPAESMYPEVPFTTTKADHQGSGKAHTHSATMKARSVQTVAPSPLGLSYGERVDAWQALVSSPEWPEDAHPYMKAPGATPAHCISDVQNKLYRIHLTSWDDYSSYSTAESHFFSQKTQTSVEVEIPLVKDSLALINGTLINQDGYVGGIVANDQLQWDRPSQSGTRWNSGFCIQTLDMVQNANQSNHGSVLRLALGDRTQFWTCSHDEALAKLYWSQVNADCQPVMVALDQVYPPVEASTASLASSMTSSAAAITTGWIKMTINDTIQAAVPATKPVIMESGIVYSASPTICSISGGITTDYIGVPISTVLPSVLLGKPIKRQASAADAEGQGFVGDMPTQRDDILTTGTATVPAQTVTDYDDAESAIVYTFPKKVLHYTNVPILPAGKAALIPGAAIARRQEQDGDDVDTVTVTPTSTSTTFTTLWDLTSSSTVATRINNAKAEESSMSDPTTAQPNSTTTSSFAFVPTTHVVLTTEVTNLTITSKPGATYTTRANALATGLSELCEVGQITGCQPLYDPKTLANNTMPPLTSFNATGLPTLPPTVTSTKMVDPTVHSSGPKPSVSPSPSADLGGKVEVVGMRLGMGMLGVLAVLLA